MPLDIFTQLQLADAHSVHGYLATVTAVDTATGVCTIDPNDDGGPVDGVAYVSGIPAVGDAVLALHFDGALIAVGGGGGGGGSVAVSGVWGANPLDRYPETGDTLGQPIYVDSAGKIRTQPLVIAPTSDGTPVRVAADLPAVYPLGMSVLGISGADATAGGWPTGSATVVTFSRAEGDLGATPNSSAAQLWFRNTASAASQDARFRSGSAAGWTPWLQFAADTGWVDGGTGTSVFVANGTNFTLTSSWGRIRNGICEIYISGTMKVASSAPGTTGDINSIVLGTAAAMFGFGGGGAGLYRPLSSGQTGRLVGGYIDSGGGVQVTSISGSSALAVSEAVSIGGTFIV